jgi:hypothetical protein
VTSSTDRTDAPGVPATGAPAPGQTSQIKRPRRRESYPDASPRATFLGRQPQRSSGGRDRDQDDDQEREPERPWRWDDRITLGPAAEPLTQGELFPAPKAGPYGRSIEKGGR